MSPADVNALLEGGVPEVVIRAMRTRMSGDKAQLGTPVTPSAPVQAAETRAASQEPRPPYASPEPPVARITNIPPDRQTTGPSLGETYLGAGMWDLGLEGMVLVPHASAADVEGDVSVEVGRMITDGNEVGVSLALLLQRNAQDVYLSGHYRYNFGSATSRVRPFLGAGAGVNVLNISNVATASNFLAVGESGVRCFVSRNVSFNLGYNLIYVRIAGLGFKDSSMSLVSAGFSYVF